MPAPKVGDKFDYSTKFEWTPIVNDDPRKPGMPEEYSTEKEWKNKRIVLISVPGAFTPGCQGVHIPPFVDNLDDMISKGADLVAVIGSNDCWVMNAWGKVNGVKCGANIHFLSDSKTKYAEAIGWMAGTGRNGRFAMIIDKDGVISYAELEKKPRDVKVSSFATVMSKL